MLGGGRGDCCGLRAKDLCNTNKTCAASSLTFAEEEKEHATYLQNICHILLNGKAKDFAT